MSIFCAAIKGFGKALTKKKAKDKISKSAKKYVDLKTKMNKDKPDLVKQSGPSRKEVMGYSGAVGASAAAGIYIKKNKKRLKK